MANIGGFDIPLPSFGGGLAGIGSTLLIGAIAFIVCLIIAIGIWFYYQKKLFNIEIKDFENLSGQGWRLTFKDKARLIKIGDGGEEILFLQKRKSYRTAYGKKMGKNEYWFSKGQDGYWYNTVLGDFDAKMGMLDIEPVDRDMRYMHVAIRKNIQDRYKKQNFMEKYGSIIMNFVFLVIMLVGIWFLIDKLGKVSNNLIAATEIGKGTLEVVKNALSKVGAVCAGGSGIR